MNRTLLNKKSNALLKKRFEEMGITSCEICNTNDYLSWAHRKKRRFYNSVEELSDFNEVLLLCVWCHTKLEFDKELTEHWFSKLRN